MEEHPCKHFGAQMAVTYRNGGSEPKLRDAAHLINGRFGELAPRRWLLLLPF